MLTIEERINFYDKNYIPLETPHFGKNNSTIMLGAKNQPCRFCGKKAPDVKFKTVAHAIPESLGNKSIILLNECDSCNKFFSENLENHFDHYTKPYRTMGQIKGKEKIPSYKSKDHKTNLIYKNGKLPRITSEIGSDNIHIDQKNSEIKFYFDREPYIPVAVYKCLVKMALSIAPEGELDNFKNAIRWILCPDHSRHYMKPLFLQEAFIPGPKPNPILFFAILKKNNLIVNYPSYVFFIAFGNVAFQIMVPSNLDIAFSSINSIPMFIPTPFECEKYGSPKFTQINMTSHEIVKNDRFPVTFHFDSMSEIDNINNL